MTVLKKNLMTAALITLLSTAPGLVLAAGTDANASDTVNVEQVQEKLSKALDSVSDYTVQQREEAVQNSSEVLAEIDTEIEALEVRVRDNWADMKEETRETTSAALANVRTQRNQLAEKFGALKDGSDNAWDDIKKGFSSAWGDLKSAWKDADTESRAKSTE